MSQSRVWEGGIWVYSLSPFEKTFTFHDDVIELEQGCDHEQKTSAIPDYLNFSVLFDTLDCVTYDVISTKMNKPASAGTEKYLIFIVKMIYLNSVLHFA